MAYKEKKYRFKDSIEYEYTYKGNYGAKGEQRAPRKKATKEQVKKQNQKNRENRLRRVIKANFVPRDMWCCLKYPKGYRIALDEVRKDLKTFLSIARKEYKKCGAELKYICRLEIGKHGGIHVHILVNRIWTQQTDVILEHVWEQVLRKRGIPERQIKGKIDHESIYEAGGFQGLAKYITKKPEEGSKEYRQLSLFEQKEQKQLLSISSSRNLIRPEPEIKTYSHWTMRRLIENGPKPQEGFYIDKDSVVCGINPYTGMSYYRYTEIRIRGKTERGSP